MIVIAHRGHWGPSRPGNSPEAIFAALRRGWSVEVDVAVRDGRCLVQHDPSEAGYPVEDVFCNGLAGAGRVFWNVKSPGVDEAFRGFFRAYSGLRERSVFFDMELVGQVGAYADLPFLARLDATHRVEAALALPAEGVWVDGTLEDVQHIEAAGRAIYLVSPELHGRPVHIADWHVPVDGICTDHPELLAGLLARAPELFPTEAWWD